MEVRMSVPSTDGLRLLRVSEANLRNSHLSVRNDLDFFPSDCLGPSRKPTNVNGHSIELSLAGLGTTIRTDIPSDKKILRERRSIKQFYSHHAVKPGDFLSLERISERKYRLKPTRSADRSGEQFTAAEFFAGIGLVRLALENQGWQVVFANDIDPAKAEMYRHNWPADDHLVVGDIHALKTKDIPECDLFTASFPCNDLSIAGKWEGLSGRESSSFWGFIEVIRGMADRKPRLVLLENVVGFLMSHGGKDLERALLALNELGYTVDAFILNARHWVPQSRARLFVVAKLGESNERKTVGVESGTRPASLATFINLNQHIRWDIQKLPKLPKLKQQLVDIIEELPADDPHWWNEKRADYFMGQFSEKHEAQAKRMVNGRKYTYATAFRRVRKGKSMAELRTDGIAGCLRTPRGGSGRQILLKAGRGKYQVRLLTARECARLQGVPDSYTIDVPLNQALFGFGDAVCVPAIEWIARNYLTSAAALLTE
jgi:DNA (cytosine-5)-methyltransferase 1